MEEALTIDQIVDGALKQERENKAKTYVQRYFFIGSLSGCLRGAYLERLGHKPPELPAHKYRVFRCGYIFEDFISWCFKEKGILLESQTEIIDESLGIKGRLDFITKPGQNPRVVECKSVHSNKWFWDRKRGTGPSDSHKMQVSMYWHYRKDKYPNLEASVVQGDKNSLMLYEYVLPHDELQAYASRGLENAAILKHCWDNKVLPPIPDTLIKEFGKWRINYQADYCGVHHLCLGDVDWKKKAEKQVKLLNK